MVSCHGQKRHLVRKIAENGKVFAILGTGTQIGELAKELLQYGLWEVTLHIGERLSYPGEKIRSGPPKEFLCCKTDTLSVLCVENPKPRNRFAFHSLQDDLFVRGKVPMTKEEVRSITLSKLQLEKVLHGFYTYRGRYGTGGIKRAGTSHPCLYRRDFRRSHRNPSCCVKEKPQGQNCYELHNAGDTYRGSQGLSNSACHEAGYRECDGEQGEKSRQLSFDDGRKSGLYPFLHWDRGGAP